MFSRGVHSWNITRWVASRWPSNRLRASAGSACPVLTTLTSVWAAPWIASYSEAQGGRSEIRHCGLLLDQTNPGLSLMANSPAQPRALDDTAPPLVTAILASDFPSRRKGAVTRSVGLCPLPFLPLKLPTSGAPGPLSEPVSRRAALWRPPRSSRPPKTGSTRPPIPADHATPPACAYAGTRPSPR
jgi:hypothetical protein